MEMEMEGGREGRGKRERTKRWVSPLLCFALCVAFGAASRRMEHG